MMKIFLFTLLIIGSAVSQQIPDNVSDLLPKEVQQINSTQINATLEQAKEVFLKKCIKNSDEDAFHRAEAAKEVFELCLKSFVNVTILQQEMEAAKPNGELDEVFKKYCNKSDVLKQCFRDLTDSIKPCLDDRERANLVTVHNITEQLAEFICFKEGDRIALFIAEKGPECLTEQQEAIQECTNRTMGDSFTMPSANVSLDSLPELAFDDKQCHMIDQLRDCVVTSLEKCQQPTPGNIADSLFKFVRKATPCKDKQVALSPGSASTAVVAMSTLLVGLAAGLLV